MKKIEFNEEEIEVLEKYIFKKLVNLENSGLTDAKCYTVLYGIRRKLMKGNKE